MIIMWIYQSKQIIAEDIPEKSISFIYKITHNESGKWYIGRKGLYKTAYRQIKGKKKKIKVDSDWKEYWSSSEFLQNWVKEEGEDKFTREILLFTETAAATTYAEEASLYFTGALFDPNCLNGNIRSKIFKKWFINKEQDLHNKIMKALK